MRISPQMQKVPIVLSGDFLYVRSIEKYWRRGSGSNRRIKVLQTSPLPLGYRAVFKDGRPAIPDSLITPAEPTGLGLTARLERETGLEPATLALARRCSTTELLPHGRLISIATGRLGGQ